jgi:metal-responsive CopG/Arc/MetJ family transcriptional regulator
MRYTPKKIVLQVPLEDGILDQFDFIFEKSGFKSKTEFVRFLIITHFQIMKANNND